MIIQNNVKNIYPKPRISDQKVNAQKSLNFSGPRLAHQSFEEFEKFAEKTDFLASLKSILKEANFLESGAANCIYTIPNNNTFLLRIHKKASIENELTKELNIKKASDAFPKNNLGQKVALIGDRISVVIKQSGSPNGIKHWYEIFSNNEFSQKKLPEFIEKLKLNAGMNQKAYETMAEEIKLIHNKNHTFDYINPRNILVDKEQQAFNIVDVEPLLKFRHKLINLNSSNHMLMSLLDERQFMTAFHLSDASQKKEIEIAAKQIRDKTKIAAEKTSLKQNEFLLRMKLKYFDIRTAHEHNLFKNYTEFKKFLDNL